MNLRVERLDPTVHHFGKSRQLGNVTDNQPCRRNGCACAAGRHQLDASIDQRPRRLQQSGLVRDRQQGATWPDEIGSRREGRSGHVIQIQSRPIRRGPGKADAPTTLRRSRQFSSFIRAIPSTSQPVDWSFERLSFMMQILDGGPKSLAPVDFCSFARPVRSFERSVGGRGSFLRPLHSQPDNDPFAARLIGQAAKIESLLGLSSTLSISNQSKRPTASFLH